MDEHEHRRIRLRGRKDVQRLVAGRPEGHVERAPQPVARKPALVDVVPRVDREVGHRGADVVLRIDLRLRGELAVERRHGHCTLGFGPCGGRGRPAGCAIAHDRGTRAAPAAHRRALVRLLSRHRRLGLKRALAFVGTAHFTRLQETPHARIRRTNFDPSDFATVVTALAALAAAVSAPGALAQSEGGLYIAGARFSFQVAAERAVSQNASGRRFFLLRCRRDGGAAAPDHRPARGVA